MSLIAAAVLAGTLAGAVPQGGQTEAMKQTMARLENELATKYGESERPRIQMGIQQAASFWRRRTATRRPSRSSSARTSPPTPSSATPSSPAWSGRSSRSTGT